MMETVLSQINAVPGVVGSLVCDEDGRLAARLFPQLFDSALVEEAAAVLADSTFGLESATGAVELLDFRFSEARIVVKPMVKAFLLLLCTKAVNLQLLSISLNVATKKLEKLHAEWQARGPVPVPQPAAVVPPDVLPLPAAPPASAVSLSVAGEGVRLTVQAMRNTPNTYWDNMVEMVTINRATSIFIGDHCKTGPFKKLKLTNPSNGRSKKFPVYVIKDDAERLFEGKAVVSLASMESLGVKGGDAVVATVEVGGGLFGWEGI